MSGKRVSSLIGGVSDADDEEMVFSFEHLEASRRNVFPDESPGHLTAASVPVRVGNVMGSGRASVGSAVTAPSAFELEPSASQGVRSDGLTTLILVEEQDLEDLCRGQVGTKGDKWCCRNVHDCTYSSHDKKMAVKANTLYLRAAGKQGLIACFSPSLPTSRLHWNNDLAVLLSAHKPVGIWTTFLATRAAMGTPSIAEESETGRVTWDEEAANPGPHTIEEMEAAMKVFATPGKIQSRIALERKVMEQRSGGTPMASLGPPRDLIPSFSEDLDEIADPPVRGAIDEMRNHLVTHATVLGEQDKALRSVIKDITKVKKVRVAELDIMESFKVKIDSLSTLVGSEYAASDQADSLSVWETMKGLEALFDLQDKRLDSAFDRIGDLQAHLDKSGERLNRFTNHVTKLANSYQTTTPDLQEDIKDLKESLRDMASSQRTLKRRIKVLEDGRGKSTGDSDGEAGIGPSQRDFRNMVDRVNGCQAAIEHVQEEMSRSAAPHQDSMPGDLFSRLSNLEGDCTDLKQRIVGSNTYEFGGKVIGSFSDVMRVFGPHLSGMAIGQHLDIFMGLCHCGDSHMLGKDYADQVYAAQKIECTALDTDFLASLGHGAPGGSFRSMNPRMPLWIQRKALVIAWPPTQNSLVVRWFPPGLRLSSRKPLLRHPWHHQGVVPSSRTGQVPVNSHPVPTG